MSDLSMIFTTPVLTNIMLGCFVAAAACMAVSYHRRMREMISVLQQIANNTQKS